MPTIHVAKAFILSLDSGEKLSIGVGRHQVSDEVAQHWYTQAHLFGVYTGPTSRPPPVPASVGQRFLNAVSEQ